MARNGANRVPTGGTRGIGNRKVAATDPYAGKRVGTTATRSTQAAAKRPAGPPAPNTLTRPTIKGLGSASISSKDRALVLAEINAGGQRAKNMKRFLAEIGKKKG